MSKLRRAMFAENVRSCLSSGEPVTGEKLGKVLEESFNIVEHTDRQWIVSRFESTDICAAVRLADDGTISVHEVVTVQQFIVCESPRDIIEQRIEEWGGGFYEGSAIGDLEYVRTDLVEHKSWSVVSLHVYKHKYSNELIGVLEEVGATENQHETGNVTVVDIEEDYAPRYVVKA